MKNSGTLFQVGLFLIWALVSCKQSEDAGAVTEIYPSLEEQREALINRDAVNPYRVLDSAALLNDFAFLSSKECEGRRPGTTGHGLALQRILDRMRAAGVDSLNGSLIHQFTGRSLNGNTEGKNVIGWIKGKKYPGKYLVLTAHYDHLGIAGNGAVYTGADDNASGTACLLAIAQYLQQHQPDYSVVLALLDREESGLEGAYASVTHLKNELGAASLVFNLNLDMIARSDKNELFVCGVRYNPSLAKIVSEIQPKTSVNLLMGHDGAGPGDDWTSQSDHAAYHKEGIPFLYLGVEDHPDYHKTSDNFEKVNPSKYLENSHAVLLLLEALEGSGKW